MTVCIARAVGVGAGRFAAAALRDAMGGGLELVRVENARSAPQGSDSAVDFILSARDQDGAEVIRIGVDGDGRVVGTEVLRAPAELADPASPDLGLTELSGGDSIDRLEWSPKEGRIAAIELVLRTERRLAVALPP